MRNEILRMLENNSRIDLHDLAIMLGTDESMVLEEIGGQKRQAHRRQSCNHRDFH